MRDTYEERKKLIKCVSKKEEKRREGRRKGKDGCILKECQTIESS